MVRLVHPFATRENFDLSELAHLLDAAPAGRRRLLYVPRDGQPIDPESLHRLARHSSEDLIASLQRQALWMVLDEPELIDGAMARIVGAIDEATIRLSGGRPARFHPLSLHIVSAGLSVPYDLAGGVRTFWMIAGTGRIATLGGEGATALEEDRERACQGPVPLLEARAEAGGREPEAFHELRPGAAVAIPPFMPMTLDITAGPAVLLHSTYWSTEMVRALRIRIVNGWQRRWLGLKPKPPGKFPPLDWLKSKLASPTVTAHRAPWPGRVATRPVADSPRLADRLVRTSAVFDGAAKPSASPDR